MQNLETRFEQAMKEIRKQGVKARRNVPGCCSGCIDLGVTEDTPIIWHFGGQGNHFKIEFDDAFLYYDRNHRSVEQVYFIHNGLTDENGITKAGLAVLNTFGKHGIVVEWDESGSQCLILDFKKSVAELAVA
jgi:hypothetical protein